jgi:ribosome-associated heat shock protein Hsp15
MRLDLYLFRARLFKSRSQAGSACKEGKVLVDDVPAKAAGEVQAGQTLKIRHKGLYTHIHIDELPGKNMSKVDARETWTDATPEDVKQQREEINLAARAKGPRREGARPTKKERRKIDKIRGRR